MLAHEKDERTLKEFEQALDKLYLLMNMHDALKATVMDLFVAADSRNTYDLGKLEAEFEEADRDLATEVLGVQQEIEMFTEASALLAEQHEKEAIVIISIFLVIVFAIGIAFSINISNAIRKPIVQIVDAANRFAVGDMDFNAVSAGNDEVGQLSRAFTKLKTALEGVTALSAQIANGDLTAEIQKRSDKRRAARIAVEDG
ncbi:MAG: cell wall metabolism sensor histidine kinase WalK [Bacteroidales bacterium]|nr:cell wall metabolism sensor histidine kinase WalK [Bacteroidales bacterium]